MSTRTLCLNSYDINSSSMADSYGTDQVITSTGTITVYFNSMIWNDINLRTQLGTYYFDKYTTFSIKLIQCMVGDLASDTTLPTSNSSVEFRLAGLPFKNYNATPYNISNINAVNEVSIYTGSLTILPSMTSLSTTSGSKIIVDDPQTYLFTKPTSDTVTLKIRRMNPTTQDYSNVLGYGHFRFIFEISGIQ
jgi:hypothetical protein